MVSIVYLTKNGGVLFRQSLESVFRQDINSPFEVIAIDSGSTDGTLDVLSKYPVRVEHIAADKFNFGLTRDLGFSIAQGEILVALSQDAVFTGSDGLRHLCEPFNDTFVASVQGREIPWPDRDIFFWNKIGQFYFTRETKRWRKSHQGVGLSFVNCAVRRSIWERNLLGQVEMSEDKVFQKMLAEQGHKIVFAPKATVWHSHQYDRESLAKRCINEGLGWKEVGIDYTRGDMRWDMFHPLIWLFLAYGLMTLQIRTSAELLFPWVRPINLYKGNHSTGGYVR